MLFLYVMKGPLTRKMAASHSYRIVTKLFRERTQQRICDILSQQENFELFWLPFFARTKKLNVYSLVVVEQSDTSTSRQFVFVHLLGQVCHRMN